MNHTVPDFLALGRIEEELLASRLEAVRKVLTHSGEKGRSLESEVMALMRSFLPHEYGLCTGFVVYHSEAGPCLSPQLDIIIYDHVRSGPVARLTTCDVLPLEAVYGYVEVKSSIQSSSDNAERLADSSIEKCILTNKELRGMDERRFWKPVEGSATGAELKVIKPWLGIRSYVFAFSAEGTIASDPASFSQRIANVSRRIGPPVHLHGVFVAGSAYYATRAVDVRTAKLEDFYQINYTTNHPLAAFKWSLMHDLARFARFPEGWTPAVDQYRKEPEWRRCAPSQSS